MGRGGDLSNALVENASTIYLRSCGIDDSTGANGIFFGRGGGDLRYPLVGDSACRFLSLVEVVGCIANNSTLKAAA